MVDPIKEEEKKLSSREEVRCNLKNNSISFMIKAVGGACRHNGQHQIRQEGNERHTVDIENKENTQKKLRENIEELKRLNLRREH